MQLCKNKTEMRAVQKQFRDAGGDIGLVTTMGFLHDGHIELVRQARVRCQHVIATIFVNPTQFGPNEDLSTYPEALEQDLALLKEAGADAVFLPTADEMYPEGASTIVEAPALSRALIGKIRPGHFRGVTTIVTKLFNICQPDYAFFGEKDFQQLNIIKKMVKDLDIPIKIIGVPTVRESDGLAMSSRNVRLLPAHRKQAVALSQSLTLAEDAAKFGTVTVAGMKKLIAGHLKNAPDASVESIDIRDAETLKTIRGKITKSAVALLAVRFGTVLLIDQRVLPIPLPKDES